MYVQVETVISSPLKRGPHETSLAADTLVCCQSGAKGNFVHLKQSEEDTPVDAGQKDNDMGTCPTSHCMSEVELRTC